MKKYKVVSLFSGCGGLDLGLEQANFEVIWANDVEKSVVETYNYNIGNIVQKDIQKIHENEIPDCDVITAGFPCQPFSSAGNRKGLEDERGNLFQECIRVIKEKKPKVIIFENVRGILSIKNLDGSFLIDTIIYLLENLNPGYNVTYKLLKASDYGVPQQRYRVIFVGFRKDLNIHYEFPKPTHSSNDKSLTVGNIIDVPDELPNQKDVWKLSPQSSKLIPYISEGGSWKDIPYELLPERLKKIKDNMKKYRAPNFYRRFARHEINGTITAAATPEKCGIIHPLENRRYSVREIARIQSFPDDFVFLGESISAKYKMIGNAVPPMLGKVIGESIFDLLKSAKSNNIDDSLKVDINGELMFNL
ncbi:MULTISPECIES: DNA cytosine methyltransferase [Staphylococcus]|uniref:DNA cytosine methyltransferase n=1 Tax=Staphylococcus TaxID=1279 RepID=UPI001886C191|nr:DNA cytosine methyltransferase [Staphylococcus epidermidis]MBF2285558.1 DNA cytosine methyltransferase [Staphylococcus epidermidis]MBF2290191.1 DNA cytosine methyltransferase [Staphylococcus epidermidis]MBF2292483.1 DNA cytosine methyltransferase [Staphylococcus epidermidis]MBF2294797.1 DNA cytosine methyltransferase [Staphylococcus epidermidis]MBF2299371.1 DNA cytosine methyltransferase [Staphylococcus epidermidis]